MRVCMCECVCLCEWVDWIDVDSEMAGNTYVMVFYAVCLFV